MQFIVPVSLLCLLVLQQTIDAALFTMPGHSSINEGGRSHVARRLRAPLMGRSITTTTSDNDADFIENGIDNTDGDEFMNVSKRRYIVALLSRRRGANGKKKRPLFG